MKELTAGQEIMLQACWARQLFTPRALRTTSGQGLEVLFPGWLNNGPGPDFTEARILLDGVEIWGDVEIHLDAQDWTKHGHGSDPAYQRVLLHVVLTHPEYPATLPISGERIPTLNAASFLAPPITPMLDNAEKLLQRYDALPGRCGLRAAMMPPERLEHVVGNAAEKRARDKAVGIQPQLVKGDPEEVLYTLVCHYLGMKAHAAPFDALARAFPLSRLQPLLELPLAQSRDAVLARWFGALGMLEALPESAVPSGMDAEYRRWHDIWVNLPESPRISARSKRPTRPWNTIERRLLGLFHHLYISAHDGWLKTWLKHLKTLDDLRNAPEFRKEALSILEECFPSPVDEPWLNRLAFHKKPQSKGARFIGEDRVVILMANAILPFFLAWARNRQDQALEKVLYRLHLVLPPEGENHRTRFMKKRLALFHPLRRSLRNYQGLLQIHQDFCTSFQQGCERCTFPDLISEAK